MIRLNRNISQKKMLPCIQLRLDKCSGVKQENKPTNNKITTITKHKTNPKNNIQIPGVVHSIRETRKTNNLHKDSSQVRLNGRVQMQKFIVFAVEGCSEVRKLNGHKRKWMVSDTGLKKKKKTLKKKKQKQD